MGTRVCESGKPLGQLHPSPGYPDEHGREEPYGLPSYTSLFQDTGKNDVVQCGPQKLASVGCFLPVR